MNDFEKHKFVLEKIQEICENIYKRKERTMFNDIVEYLYEKIEDEIENYLPERDYDN